MKPIITAELEYLALGTGDTGMRKHIADALKEIDKLGVKYQLTPMGTVLEVATIDDAFRAVKAAHEALVKSGVKRVVTHLTIDDRRDNPKGMEDKMEAVRRKL
ncbi:MAG: MTH1187 family thiamine-binding protein [Candidatus Methanoperedens sp.]|nr:MTH1187 family thiamine-binding protein [Candidatus Methanoperedens sp.]